MSGESIELEGVVMDVHPSDFYSIEIQIGSSKRRVIARRSGRLNQHHIRIIAGDRVRVEVSPYDVSRGRITRRL